MSPRGLGNNSTWPLGTSGTKGSIGRTPAGNSKEGKDGTQLGSSLGQWQSPVGGIKADFNDGEVTLQGGRGWGPREPAQQPAGPLKQRRMLVTTSACSQPD